MNWRAVVDELRQEASRALNSGPPYEAAHIIYKILHAQANALQHGINMSAPSPFRPVEVSREDLAAHAKAFGYDTKKHPPATEAGGLGQEGEN